MKILVGVLLALLLALGLTGWQLQKTREALVVSRTEQSALKDQLAVQAEQSRQLADRMDAFSQSVVTLMGIAEQHDQNLKLAVAGIDNITKTENDSDESISCLDQRVPADLDQWLR